MTLYEQLLEEAYQEGIIVKEVSLNSNADGLYMNNKIAINNKIPTSNQKSCILAEELGHHYTTVGNILDTNNIDNNKQELKARQVAYNKIASIESIANISFKNNITDLYELADITNISYEFLTESLEYYISKYGEYIKLENYLVILIPSLYVYKYNN